MQEVWKDIKGYEGIYQVSNFGNVKSLDRADCTGRNLKGNTSGVKLAKIFGVSFQKIYQIWGAI